MNNNSERIKLSKLSKYKNIKSTKVKKEIKDINDSVTHIHKEIDESNKKIIVEELNLIPKNIFQTWRDLELTKDMKETIEYLKYMNNGFNYYLYDDKMCRDFIKDNYDEKILEAYDKIIPGAYKSDLWRCCILYKYGGIYLDIKYKPKNNFSFAFFLDKEYYARDRQTNNKYGIYNALMIYKPKSEMLKKFIDKIVENINNNFYGNSALDITGPQCLNNFFTQEEILNFDLDFDGTQILYKKIPILEEYKNYRAEQKKILGYHYSDLWNKRIVYQKDEIKNNISQKINYEPIINRKIFQTWKDLNLPINMKVTVNELRDKHNNYEYYLYTDEMCRNFIKENFDNKILEAFDKVIPGAYKADLWRCCVLYKYGGIYLDIKYKPINNFTFEKLLDKEYYVRDRQKNNKYGIYNALMICKPKSEKLKKIIDKIVENINNKYYGDSALDISGPQCLNNFFTQKEILNFELEFNGSQIVYKTQPILEKYSSYRTEQKQSGLTHYSKLWDKKMVYKK